MALQNAVIASSPLCQTCSYICFYLADHRLPVNLYSLYYIEFTVKNVETFQSLYMYFKIWSQNNPQKVCQEQMRFWFSFEDLLQQELLQARCSSCHPVKYQSTEHRPLCVCVCGIILSSGGMLWH